MRRAFLFVVVAALLPFGFANRVPASDQGKGRIDFSVVQRVYGAAGGKSVVSGGASRPRMPSGGGGFDTAITSGGGGFDAQVVGLGSTATARQPSGSGQ